MVLASGRADVRQRGCFRKDAACRYDTVLTHIKGVRSSMRSSVQAGRTTPMPSVRCVEGGPALAQRGSTELSAIIRSAVMLGTQK
jgi:hypothetical protein